MEPDRPAAGPRLRPPAAARLGDLPRGRGEVFLTGLYGHTGAALPSPREAVTEAATLLRILQRMAGAPRSSRER